MKKLKLKNTTLVNNGRRQNAKSLYVKELKWKVILPSKVVNYLVHKIDAVKPFKGFRLEIAIYFLSLISSVPARKKNGNYFKGFVPLNSKLLEKIKYNYKKYFEYFVLVGLVEKINYSTDVGRSNSYRYNYKNVKIEGLEYLDFTSFDFTTLQSKSFNYFPFDEESQRSCAHLTEWLDHGLHLDFELFLTDYSERFSINKFEDDRDLENKIQAAKNFYYSGYDFYLQNWRATRNPATDNRLHTNLTNLDKDIRKYVRYQGAAIQSLDLKNSQPYFLILFIEEIIKQNRNKEYKNVRLDSICKNIYGNKCIMFEKLSQQTENELFIKEFSIIKDAITTGQYYEFLGGVFDDILPIHTDENGIEIYEGKFFDKSIKKIRSLKFKGKRNLMKKVSMQLLYTPLTKPSQYYETFRAKFPAICEFIEILKTSTDDPNSFKKFPKLLQHYEADCVLDFVTKKVAEKYPEMPLFTIHDSIATTWFWFEFLKKEVKTLLKEYSSGMPPILECETWGQQNLYDQIA